MKEAWRIDTARASETAGRLLEEHHLPGMGIGVVSGEDGGAMTGLRLGWLATMRRNQEIEPW